MSNATGVWVVQTQQISNLKLALHLWWGRSKGLSESIARGEKLQIKDARSNNYETKREGWNICIVFCCARFAINHSSVPQEVKITCMKKTETPLWSECSKYFTLSHAVLFERISAEKTSLLKPEKLQTIKQGKEAREAGYSGEGMQYWPPQLPKWMPCYNDG